MRITSLTIKNFKGIDEHGIRIDFAPITLLFGPNNAGKSTVIQALHLAREIFCHPKPDLDTIEICGKGLDVGTFKDYVHKHDLGRQVRIGLQMTVDGLPVCGDELERQQWKGWSEVDTLLNHVHTVAVEIAVGWNYQAQRAELSEYTVSINGRLFTSMCFVAHANSVIADISLFDVSGFLQEGTREKLREQAENVLRRIGESPDDYGNELLDLKDAVQETMAEAIPPLLYPMADMRRVLTEITGSDELSSLATGEVRTVRCALGAGRVPDWSGGLPLEFADIHPDFDDDPQAFSHDYIMNCLTLFCSFLLSPGKLAQNILDTLLYVGPLRTIPDRGFYRTQKPTATRWAEGLAAWDVLATASDAQLVTINQCLHGADSLQAGYTVCRKRLLNLEAESPLVPALRKLIMDDIDEGALPLLRDFLAQVPEIRLMIRNEATGVEVAPHDVGVGISQVLPVIVAAVTAKHGALIAMEQPELHIHPAWQTALGDVFIRAVPKIENPPIFLLETHSEHLLLRLLRRIRHTHVGTAPESVRLSPTDLAVHWIGNYEGRTEAYRLGLDEDGSFNTPWPEGFFDERGEELFG